jgi:hypothetical protein
MRFVCRLLLFIGFSSVAQDYVQNIKGKISDKESGTELPGVIIRLKGDTTNKFSCVSDFEGRYKITGVKVGRRTFVFQLTGYKPFVATDVVLVSGKEMVLNVEMESSVQEIEEVVVKAQDKGVYNEMSSVSTKLFSVEETDRYAGSRGDPARMASNFAGVSGTNDARNDIVIRGNSPSGLLWRLEEIDIPNPNHFAVAGSMGGPVSIINNKYLANSEFFTAAFPAQYSNALGGVFDLKMRNGNNEKHERTFQLGILGTELMLEGPISKKSGASYMINYRYSTMDLFSAFNIKIGTSAVPQYQDAAFRFNFPTKKAGTFSISGIGGLSKINIVLSKIKERPKELYGDQNRDQFFRTNMGVIMANHVVSLNDKTMLKTSIAHSISDASTDHYIILRDKTFKPNDTLPHILNYQFIDQKTTLTSYIRRKINNRNSFKTGLYINRIQVNHWDSVKIISASDTLASLIEKREWKNRTHANESFFLIQPFFHFNHKFSDNLTLNLGLAGQWMSLNNAWSVEPRLGIKWNINAKNMLSLGYGLHSQTQPSYIYFAFPDTIVRNGIRYGNHGKSQENRNLGFSKAHHVVLGFDHIVSQYMRIKLELYYQYLWNIPVYEVPSSVSLINRGTTFTRFFPVYGMQNKGTGYNYGLELTVERSFHKHFFVLFSGSVFNSKYKASNGKEFNTDYNGKFITNLLGGLEYDLGKKKRHNLSFGPKLTYGGGRLYSPVDRTASDRIMEVVPQDSLINTLQFADYFRLDFRLAYKINFKKVSTEIALDLVNVTDQRNVLALTYAPDPTNPTADPLVRNYQLGRLPLFYIKVDF